MYLLLMPCICHRLVLCGLNTILSHSEYGLNQTCIQCNAIHIVCQYTLSLQRCIQIVCYSLFVLLNPKSITTLALYWYALSRRLSSDKRQTLHNGYYIQSIILSSYSQWILYTNIQTYIHTYIHTYIQIYAHANKYICSSSSLLISDQTKHDFYVFSV